jgi:hypothetical protein
MSDFDAINNTVDIRDRETVIKLRLKTYGTLEQCQKSIEKVAYELRLQKLDVEVDDIYTAADDLLSVVGEQPTITPDTPYSAETVRENRNVFEDEAMNRRFGIHHFDSIED